MKIRIIGVMVALLVFVMACTSTQKSNNPTVDLHIDAYSWGFTQDPVTINKGDKGII